MGERAGRRRINGYVHGMSIMLGSADLNGEMMDHECFWKIGLCNGLIVWKYI